MPKTVTTRLEDAYVEKIDEIAERKGLDCAALLRSFLLYALKDNILHDSLEDYAAGKISLWETAERCGLSLWEMIQEAKRRHIHVPYDRAEFEKDMTRLDG